MNKKLLLLVSMLALAVVISGCGIFGGDGSGTLQMSITDAPVDNIDKLNVTIDKIETHSSERGWEIFSEETKTFDLLSLQGVSDVLGETELPTGHYTQIRLYVTDAEVVEDNGDTYNVTVPSGAQTGLKLVQEFTIEDNVVKALLLDFDARKSLITESSGNYKLKPTIRVIERVVSGDLKGEVLDKDGNPATDYVVAIYEDYISDEKELTSTIVKSDGTFKILGLEEGTYTMEISDSNGNTYTQDVSITAKETTDLGTMNLEF